MKIMIDTNGNVLEKNDITMYTDIDLFTLDMKVFRPYPSKNDFQNGDVQFTCPYICIKDERLLFIATPANYDRELYHATIVEGHKENIMISDDFFEVVKKMQICRKDLESAEFFRSHGFAPIGRTLIKGIDRFRNHAIYHIDDRRFVGQAIKVHHLSLDDDGSYIRFKTDLCRIMDHYTLEDRKHSIYLSGGADSRLLLLLLSERTDDITAIINQIYPQNSMNIRDISLAKKVADIVGISVVDTSTDLFKIRLEDYEKIIRYMPNSAHLAFGFIEMGKAAKDSDFIWCGQNADSLYNYGATERISIGNLSSGVGGALRRFLLSDIYFKALHEKKVRDLPIRAFARSTCEIFKKRSTCDLDLPGTLSELVDFFQQSNSYLPLGKQEETGTAPSEDISLDQIRSRLLDHKLNFITGGDPKAVFLSNATSSKRQIIMPYSYEIMLPLFYSLQLGFKDIIYPKRFIYRYIDEFKSRYGKEITKYDIQTNAENIQQAYDKMSFSQLGQGLYSYADDPKEYDRFFGLEKIHRLLYNYWVERVFQMVDDLGVRFIG